jgi:hypothetical protein
MGFLLNWRPHITVNIVALFIQKYACAIYCRYASACKSEICKSIVEFIYRNMYAHAYATYRRYTSACKSEICKRIYRCFYAKTTKEKNCKTVKTRWC